MLKTKLQESECGSRSRKGTVPERSSGMVTFGPSERGGDNQQPSAKLWSVPSKRAVHRLSGGGGYGSLKVGIILVEKFNKTAPVNRDPDELDLSLRFSQTPSREVLIMF
jgi:hypothetical protein